MGGHRGRFDHRRGDSAGTSVTHSGTILVDGALVMTAGAGLQLFNYDCHMSVKVSQESLTGVSDLAGQALLQSGVVQASKAEFVVNAITIPVPPPTSDRFWIFLLCRRRRYAQGIDPHGSGSEAVDAPTLAGGTATKSPSLRSAVFMAISPCIPRPA